jgi:hypothetical protein
MVASLSDYILGDTDWRWTDRCTGSSGLEDYDGDTPDALMGGHDNYLGKLPRRHLLDGLQCAE